MEARIITSKSKEIHLVRQLYHESFPAQERVPFWLLMLRAKARQIDFFSFYDGERFCGLAYLSSYKNMTSVLYLAVDRQLRSNGYGSRILELLRARYQGNTIVLEVEAVDSKAQNFGQRKRRKDFYLRNGFAESGYGSIINGVTFEILKSAEDFDSKKWRRLSNRFLFGLVPIQLYRIN